MVGKEILLADIKKLPKEHRIKALEYLICLEGLYDAGDFLNNRIYGDDYLDYVRKDGKGLWQIPVRLASFLDYLVDKNITSFLDIGTFNGCTFNFIDSWLKICNVDYLGGITIDINNQIIPELASNINFIKASSDLFRFNSYDLVFIDGNHSYDYVQRDYYNVGNRARYCAFHDVDNKLCEESEDKTVSHFWNELKENRSYTEFKEHPSLSRVMGIGILVNGYKNC